MYTIQDYYRQMQPAPVNRVKTTQDFMDKGLSFADSLKQAKLGAAAPIMNGGVGGSGMGLPPIPAAVAPRPPAPVNPFQQLQQLLRTNGGWKANANRKRPVNFGATPALPVPKFQQLPVSRPPTPGNVFTPRGSY